MTSLTLEQQKRRYSRELADYTLRQWNNVKRSQIEAERISHGDRDARKRSSGTPSVERNPDSSVDDITAGISNVHLIKEGLQVVDFAKFPPKAKAGSRKE